MVAPRLPPRPREVIPAVVDGPFAAVSFPWQILPPQHARVFVVKCSLAIAPGRDAEPLAEADPPLGDVHFNDDPEASLRYASDFAPFKPRADVLLVGHAYPQTQGARIASVQLSFGRDLRRAVAAVGDRQWQDQAPTSPAAFTKLPLRYERAFGGPGYDANPVGLGYVAGAAGVRLPNLEQPDGMLRSPDDRPEPACFGPLPSTFRARSSKLGTYDDAWLRERWPYFPRDFDWGYFNVAPAAQQIAYPRGDESFSLAGVHPSVNVVNGKLPGLIPRAFVKLGPAFGDKLREVPLKLDTVWFDADEMKIALVWRGIMDVSDEHAPEIAALFVHADRVGATADGEISERRFNAKLLEVYGPAPEPVPAAAPSPAVAAATSLAPFTAGAVVVPPAMPRAEVEARLGSGASLDGVNFSGCDLSDLDLRGRRLNGALFSGAKLSGATFDGASLTGAVLAGVSGYKPSFKGADLRGANLAEAALIEADMAGAWLEDASLVDADLTRASFRGAKIARANATDARLSGAIFDEADARGTDLSGASLEAASFRGATLDDVQIYGCAAEGCCFDDASMARFRADEARLSKSTFARSRAAESTFESADLRGASLFEADLDGAVFTGANLERAVLNRATAKSVRFRHARLSQCSALKANLMEATFEGADLTKADLRGANLYAVETWKARLDGVLLEHALVAGSKLAGS